MLDIFDVATMPGKAFECFLRQVFTTEEYALHYAVHVGAQLAENDAESERHYDLHEQARTFSQRGPQCQAVHGGEYAHHEHGGGAINQGAIDDHRDVHNAMTQHRIKEAENS